MGRQALERLKIADFSWVVTGPISTSWLGGLGATIVRVESAAQLDILRGVPPKVEGVPDVDKSSIFAYYNCNKYDIALNLRHPQGQGIAKRLVAWSDLVVENFTPGTMEKFNLGYDDLKQEKEDIIMIRASMYGQTGPYASKAGYGTMMQAEAGFAHLVGLQGQMPVGQSTIAYTDTVGACDIVIAVMAALDYKRRTGRGVCIDLSQLESGIRLLSPAILDYAANDHVQSAQGNRCSYAAPHSAYRCRGDDRWCVISVFNDVEWESFCRVVEKPEWQKDARFKTLWDRKQNEDELDALVADWTCSYTAEEIMVRMQAAGIAAGVVQTGQDIVEHDPQFKHRNFVHILGSSGKGCFACATPSYRLSDTTIQLRRPPLLGEHTEYVCREFLAMTDEEFVDLHTEGVFS